MERLSDSDSDDEDTYRRLSSVVLRPAVTSLPSIGDDNETDVSDSSSETEVVFSSINWATQESAGLLFDQEINAPGTARLAADASVPTSAKARQLGILGGTVSAAIAVPSPRAAPDEIETFQDIALTPSGDTSVPKAVSPVVTATRRLIPPSSMKSESERGGVRPVQSAEPDEPYEGRGWLAGVAGRLANTAEPRRAYTAATDAEHVADAARHAAALRQQRQQQQRLTQQEDNQAAASTDGALAGDTVPAGAAVALAVAEAEQQRHYQRECEEAERLILQDFHEALQAAESEPPLVAPAGLSLESTVAGLGLDDLDALIARLTAGTVDLRPADISRFVASTAVERDDAGDGLSSLWIMQPLPTAESLWSDDEEIAHEVQRVPERGRHWEAQPGKTVKEVELPQAVEVFTAVPSSVAGAVAATPAAIPAVATPNQTRHITAPTAVGPGPIPQAAQLHGPLPAKFKFFTGLGGFASTGSQLPIPPRELVGGVGSGSNNSGRGPLLQDLRQSIAEAVQRTSREAAAMEAQRQSQAKAEAAKRRMAAGRNSSSSGGSSGEDEGTTAVRKVRPVPPVPKPAAPAADTDPTIPLPSHPAPPSAVQAALPVPPPAPQAAAAPTIAGTERPSETGDGAATTATLKVRCTSIGTDSTDLRPASRSVFVCTTERKAEEEERVQDIRNYLKSRAEAAAAAELQRRKMGEDTVTTTTATVVGERRWPEPPAAVAERIAALAEHQTMSKVVEVRAATVKEAPKLVERRVVATFAGGNEDDSLAVSKSSSNSSGGFNYPLAANGSLIGALNAPQPALPNGASTCTVTTGALDVATWAFAASSTEGDENLVAALAPASVSDASTEHGARIAVAGTFISFGSVPSYESPKLSINNISVCNNSDIPSPSALTGMHGQKVASSSLGGGRKDHANSESAQTQPEFSCVVTGVTAGADAAPVPANDGAASSNTVSHSAPLPKVLADAVRPFQLQLSAQLDPNPAAAAMAHVSPVAPPLIASSSASPIVAPQAKSPAAGAVQGAAADLCRVPAWLPHASCITLLITSPSNLTSLEVGAVLEWLLLRAAGKPHPQVPELPSFSIVGARLLAVPPSWPLLPTSAAEAAARVVPSPQTGGAVDVRVLAVACIPRKGVNADVYYHELPATAAEDAAAATAGAIRLLDALEAVPWMAVLAVSHDSSDSGGAWAQNLGNLSASSRNRGTLRGWVSTQAGLQGIFDPLRLRAYAFSQHQFRSSSTGSTVSPSAIATSGQRAAAATVPPVVVDGPGIITFVSLVTAGGLRNPHLLRHLIFRAACLGLTLRGLQIVYSTEEATAAIVSATPHRPLAYTGGTLLALSGRNDALRRWQTSLGPPDPHLACRTDPSSLHALYGDIARHITCSYDHATAVRELSVLFGVNISSVQQKGPAAGTDAASVASVGSSIVGSGTPQAQWLALPAADAEQQANALWCLHQLLWCGYSLRGLLLMRLPGEPHPAPPALVVEVSNEEATEQLPLILASLRARTQTAFVIDGAATTNVARPFFLLPEAMSSRLIPADVHSLPQPYVAEQLLVAAVGDAALQTESSIDADRLSSVQHLGGGGADSSGAGSTALHLHHGEDGLAVVALQARPIHTAALLLAAITAHTTVSGAVRGDKTAREAPSPDRLELVGCRYLRQVPSDVASCLTVLHTNQSITSGMLAGSGAANGGVAGREPHRLVISHPALLAAFHGPSAQTRIVRWLAAALQLYHSPLDQATIGSAAPAGDPGWESLLSHLRDSMPSGATSALPRPLVALSSSPATGKRALAYAFSPAHVFLDAGMHDGLHRPPLPSPFEVATSPAAAGASLEVAWTPLSYLLAGPELLPAVIALDFAAVHRNLLPRLLKQLWREGYVLQAAATIQVQAGSAAAAAMPGLWAKPAVLLHVSRSNAIKHLRALAAALMFPRTISSAGGHDGGRGGAGGGGEGLLYTCDTWRDAVSVVEEVWPQPTQQLDSCVQLAAAQRSLGGAAGCVLKGRSGTGASARRFVRPEGAPLLQLTAMVVTPSGPASDGDTPSLNWPCLSDALEALHSEGFRLAAIRAVTATPRDMSDLGRVSCRISSSQQHAIHTSAAATAAAAAAAAARVFHLPAASPLPCNLILLALARDSAVTSLQVLLDEAGRAASDGMRQGPGQSMGPGPASGVLSALTGRGPGRREAVAALAMVAPCISVAHSPAAAEQQIAAVFEDVFGAGGVPLLQ